MVSIRFGSVSLSLAALVCAAALSGPVQAAAPPAQAQCKKACTTAYQQCVPSKGQEVCMRQWQTCKAKCAPPPPPTKP